MLVWFLDLSFFSFMVLGTLIAFCVFYLLLFVSCAVGSIGEKLCWFKKADRIFKAIGLTIFAVSVCILLCSPIVLTYFAYKVAYTRSVKIYSEKVTFGEVWCNYADFKGELCKNYVKYALNEQEIAKQNELERQQAQQVKEREENRIAQKRIEKINEIQSNYENLLKEIVNEKDTQ